MRHVKIKLLEKLYIFIKYLANNDGFGEATIQKLYDEGIRKV